MLGYLLLGPAPGRARVIPWWASGLIIAAIPLQAIAYTTHLGLFQLLSYILVLIGSIPAALAMLKRPHAAAASPGEEEFPTV